MAMSGCGITFSAVAVILMVVSTTQAEPPVPGYSQRSFDFSGGYPSSSAGYVYGPPKESGIPGVPGRDYPNYSEVPVTSFSCEQQPLPGYYADQEAGCQVYHVCEKGVKEREARLCPVGSIFDQEKLTCAWWYTVDCARSAAVAPAVNSAVVAAMEKADALAKTRKYGGYGRGIPSGAYGAPSGAYGAPSGAFGAPSGAYGAPSGAFGAPSGAYGAPSGAFGAPIGSFSGSFGSYNSRSGAFNTPSRAHGGPYRGFGGSSRGFGGSSRGFGGSYRSSGSLSRAYGAPSFSASGFGGANPSGAYGAPPAGLFRPSSPSEEYGVPGGHGGGAYLPPSF